MPSVAGMRWNYQRDHQTGPLNIGSSLPGRPRPDAHSRPSSGRPPGDMKAPRALERGLWQGDQGMHWLQLQEVSCAEEEHRGLTCLLWAACASSPRSFRSSFSYFPCACCISAWSEATLSSAVSGDLRFLPPLVSSSLQESKNSTLGLAAAALASCGPAADALAPPSGLRLALASHAGGGTATCDRNDGQGIRQAEGGTL